MGSIVVAGGYGAFGSRIVERLSRDQDLDIVVAGRNADKAAAAVASLNPQAKARLSSTRLDASLATPAELAALSARVVINASGPFQTQDYTLARAAIAAGCHYVDLADARDFVMGIGALDAEASRAGVAVISGASSVPGLSSAVVEHYRERFSQIHEISIGISPGNSFDPGEATAASVLSGVGRPIRTWENAEPRTVYGWQGLSRHEFPGLGTRLMGYVDVPDLALFPDRIPGLRTIRFRAGLEVGFFHLGLYGLSWLSRAEILRHPERLARPMLAMKRRLGFLGSDSGGMFVEITGTGLDATPLKLSWTLVANKGDGPYVPGLGAVALAKSTNLDQIGWVGARPCFNCFSLAQFRKAAQGLQIQDSTTMHFQRKESAALHGDGMAE